jgi:hypothetical protein
LKKKLIIVFLLFFASAIDLKASSNEYLYKSFDPSFSNWGTTGLLNMPSARFQEPGTIALNFASHEPYSRLAGVAYPFKWMEAIYQYTDIRDRLYSPVFAFSGNQTFKDKGFDAKFKLWNESRFLPQIALGFKDLAGTSLFSSEYLVASKYYKNIDFSVGMGWGTMSNNRISNPISKLADRFSTDRGAYTGATDKGGTFSTSSYFRNEKVGLFGGAEIFLPQVKGLRIKIEYDSTNFEIEANKKQELDSRINFGFVYTVNKNLSFFGGRVRGNTLQFGFSLKKNFSRKSKSIPKNDHKILDSSDAIKQATAISDRYLYLASLQYLKEEEINVRTVGIENKKLSVAFSQSKYTSYSKAYGRALSILDQISHEEIDEFELISQNRTFDVSSINIMRDDYNALKNNRDTTTLKNKALIESGHSKSLNHQYRPAFNYPVIFYSLAPDYATHIGGADRFFAGSLDLNFQTEILLNNALNLQLDISHPIVSTFDVLDQGSDSVLPHVRTDIIQYLREGDGLIIKRAQLNYFRHPTQSLYFKFSGGLYESMFGGIGGEILYRPFESFWGIGAELYSVRQRAFDQRFKFQDYKTTTGHVTLYAEIPATDILVKLIGGRYLAEDSGFTIDLSRSFNSGLRLGVYASRTDISYEEFGEGSFDKGFYFYMPIDTIISSHSRKLTGYGMRPLTRDGAQRVNVSLDLWGLTDEGSKNNIYDTFGNFYD